MEHELNFMITVAGFFAYSNVYILVFKPFHDKQLGFQTQSETYEFFYTSSNKCLWWRMVFRHVLLFVLIQFQAHIIYAFCGITSGHLNTMADWKLMYIPGVH